MKSMWQIGCFLSVATLAFAGNLKAEPASTASMGVTRPSNAIVTSAWLSENANRSNLVILDVRPAPDYAAGHIPKAISAPFPAGWADMGGELIMEVPPVETLFATIGSLGITQSSWVVVVAGPSAGEPVSYGFARGARVADTLIYAGLRNVSLLNGGHPQWVKDGGTVTTDVTNPTPVTYSGNVRTTMFVSTEYVKQHIGMATLIDARDADVYFGVTVEPYATTAGHIPTAKSLPTPRLWDADAVFSEPKVLSRMVVGAMGFSPAREIIVYCGVGGYASPMWFVLTQVLGYPNVKFYDGSAQAWVKGSEAMVPYRWE